MSSFSVVYWIAGGLLVAMFVMMEIGRRLGALRRQRDPEGSRAGTGVVESAFFVLLGLLIAFTFSGAASRFDDRRQLVIEETNDIGTAWLRIDLLPAQSQEPMRQLFRDYLDSRLKTYRDVQEGQMPHAELQRTRQLQDAIWKLGVTAMQEQGSPAATTLFLGALNTMIDITTTRSAATTLHPPRIVFFLLIVLVLAGSLLAGDGMAEGSKRSWLHVIGFALLMSFTVYVIFDIEYPRLGFIRVDAIDQLLVELRRSMG
ncbi:MAG TPA: hypothetical protein VFR59_12410 [Steroidobacteraceae bacterium]|nr:hypothetical protein [Steroidobacteraceae bacterium]